MIELLNTAWYQIQQIEYYTVHSNELDEFTSDQLLSADYRLRICNMAKVKLTFTWLTMVGRKSTKIIKLDRVHIFMNIR